MANPNQLDLVALIVGMFDAAPGRDILEDVVAASNAGDSHLDIANSLANTAEFVSIYPNFLDNEQYVAFLVDSILEGRAPADERDAVVDDFVAEMNAGATRGQVALVAVNALRNVAEDDPVFGEAATAFNNKVEVAAYYSIEQRQVGEDLAELQGVVANVDHTDESVEAAKAAINGDDDGGNGGTGFRLTVGPDELDGTAGDDVFIAGLSSNDQGLQVNTLASGDVINGGAGTDTLVAQVTQGATHGGSSMPIAANTNSVEHVTFEAVNANQGGPGGNTTVFVDAGTRADLPSEFGMTGLESIGSAYSNGNLVIQNLTTRTDNGDLRLPSDLTITMSHTGGNNSNWSESDLHVFFAQNNLLTDVDTETTASQANYWLADQDSDDYEAQPLQNIDRDGILFTLN